MSEEKESILDGVIEEIISNYADGTLIPHEWLKKKCGLTMPDFKDYEDVSDFIKAVQMQQFSYMNFTDSIRWELIEKWNMWFKNERGEGYVILNPKDQVSFGYDRFNDGLKRLIKETNLIMNNVRAVNGEQQAKDNDLRAKYAAMRMMLETIRR